MDVFTAAYRGELQRVRALIEQDAGLVHATDHDDWTPLVNAAGGGHVEVVRYLLDHGASFNRRDDTGVTALHYACFKSNTQVVLLLLQTGADVTAASNGGSNTLMFAATIGHDTVVRALLEHGGSDVDAANGAERTACQWACDNGHPRVLRELLEAGADPRLRDADGRVAGDLAAGNGHEGCVAILEEWERAYTLMRVRDVRDAPTGTPPAAPPGL